MALSWPEQLSRVWTLSRNSSSYQEQQPTNQQFLLFCSCVIVCVCVCRFLFFLFFPVSEKIWKKFLRRKKVKKDVHECRLQQWIAYFQGIIRSETIPRDFHYGLSAYKVVIYSCARCIWIIIIRHNRSVRKKSSSAHTQHRCCRLKSDTGEKKQLQQQQRLLCMCVDVIAHHHPVFLSSNQQQQQQSEAGTNSYTFWNQIKI